MTDSVAARAELSAYYSAFQADDALITIVPSFDSSSPLPLLSSAPVGPFQAGMPTVVPLWMAMLLHMRSLCSISPPAWLATSNLSEILAHEKKEQFLWKDAERLPRNYYEIAKQLTGRRGVVFADDDAGGGSSQSHVLSLLVQDLLEVRVDKLRQQLPTVLANHAAQQSKRLDENDDDVQNMEEDDLMMTIDGIGSQELALLRPFIQQALNDRAFLLASAAASDKNKTDENDEKPATTAEPSASRPRVSLRRYRR